MSTAQTHWQWPALAATLPAQAGFALLEKIANSDRVRFPAEEEAWINARGLSGTHLPEDGGRPPNEIRWRRAWRLVQLVDHADLFIASTRRAGWIDANVSIEGAWPATGPILAVTCHWGAGLWALRHLARSGHPAHFLARALEDDAPGADAWRRRYGRLRIRATERAAACAGDLYRRGDGQDRRGVGARREHRRAVRRAVAARALEDRGAVSRPDAADAARTDRAGLCARNPRRHVRSRSRSRDRQAVAWHRAGEGLYGSDGDGDRARRAPRAPDRARYGRVAHVAVRASARHLIRVAAGPEWTTAAPARDQSTCATTITRLPLASCSYAPSGGAMRSTRVNPTLCSTNTSAS